MQFSLYVFKHMDPIVLQQPSSLAISLTAIYHRCVYLSDYQKREERTKSVSKGETVAKGSANRGNAFFRVLMVRDYCRRYSPAKKYKLNPAVTATEIWDHIVSIYHTSLRRMYPHPVPCRVYQS